ncbi:uncharacterized protein [Porites lutea]|uniref:uncharacterized protein n=1 Tax=Porites lutea TaxID=51062 RepID=UPI003CC69939
MKTLILLALLGFVLAFSLAIPFKEDTAEAYDAERNEVERDIQADEDERNKGINGRNENDQEEEDDDENVYAVQPVDDDDQEVENQDENENALTNPGNKVEEPVWPLLVGRAVFRRFRRRRRSRRRGRRWG